MAEAEYASLFRHTYSCKQWRAGAVERKRLSAQQATEKQRHLLVAYQRFVAFRCSKGNGLTCSSGPATRAPRVGVDRFVHARLLRERKVIG